jgi:hypothetical protein
LPVLAVLDMLFRVHRVSTVCSPHARAGRNAAVIARFSRKGQGGSIMSWELEQVRAEIRQAREEANQNAWGIAFLLVIIAGGGFSALSGLVMPALVLGALGLAVLTCWGLYRLSRAFCRGVADAAASWKIRGPADSWQKPPPPIGSRLFAIALALAVFGGLAFVSIRAG